MTRRSQSANHEVHHLMASPLLPTSCTLLPNSRALASLPPQPSHPNTLSKIARISALGSGPRGVVFTEVNSWPS